MTDDCLLTLAIETSCDDTSVAVVDERGFVQALSVEDQTTDHAIFGGVVPEIASRKHLEKLALQVERVMAQSGSTWDEIALISVTNRPGLIGAVMVGLMTAKTLAWAQEKPLIGVNHLAGHLWAPHLWDDDHAPAQIKYPAVGLTVSGGHSSLYFLRQAGDFQHLGGTRDDAAGEAFDKFAKMLGLGYPGGPVIDRLAQKGNPKRFVFPRPMKNKNGFEMSFSGMKTAGLRHLEVLSPLSPEDQADLAAGFQIALVETLISKCERAMLEYGCEQLLITGGVSANSQLREAAALMCRREGWNLALPALKYCTDNAAMIGRAGLACYLSGQRDDLSLKAYSRSQPNDFQGQQVR